MSGGGIRLFALAPSQEWGARVSRALGVELAPHEEREFEDGEHKSRPLVSVRNADVYVLCSLYGEPGRSANDKLIRLLFFLGALRDAAAARVTAVVPYLCYARKDRRSKTRDPVTTRYVAGLFESVGVDAVLTLDVHNLAAYENAFRCRPEHLVPWGLYLDWVAGLGVTEDWVVVAPDVGGIKRAQLFRDLLAARLGRAVELAVVEKARSGGVVSGELVAGAFEGRAAIVVDDIVASGTTLVRAAAAARSRGARRVFAAAAHGLFVGDATATLDTGDLERIAVTDTVPPWRLDPDFARRRLTVLETAPLFAEAIRRMHEGGSLVELVSS